MSFLDLQEKRIVVMGAANRKSVATHVAKSLIEESAEVILTVRSEKRREEIAKLFPDSEIWVCDVENPEDITALSEQAKAVGKIDGLVHSIAFANYAEGFKPFHETGREDFLQATQISAFSLVEIANVLKSHFSAEASVVTIGISSTTLTAENYGYMSPIKAALESMIRYLAKSFSADSGVRFNSINSGPLKTSASAGIPGYLENYLYAEKMTFRKKALQTQEVANAVLFLLSPRSSGINGAGLLIDAGLGLNFFDQDIVRSAMRPES